MINISYLIMLYNAIKIPQVYFSILLLILSIIVFRWTNSLFGFILVALIMAVLGLELSIYPLWLILLLFFNVITIGVLESKKIFGVRI